MIGYDEICRLLLPEVRAAFDPSNPLSRGWLAGADARVFSICSPILSCVAVVCTYLVRGSVDARFENPIISHHYSQVRISIMVDTTRFTIYQIW